VGALLLLVAVGATVVVLLGAGGDDRDRAAPADSSEGDRRDPDAPPPPPAGPAQDTPRAAPAPDAAQAGLKPLLGGVLDRQGFPERAFWDVIDGFVVNVAWAEVQPEPLGPLAENNAIDRALDSIRSLPDGAGDMKIKLRINAGVDAPPGAKELGGAPVAVDYEGYRDLEGAVGRFWTPEFGAAYDDLQAKLAAAYDGVPEVGQVEMTRCMTFYAETFLRQAGTPQTPQALLDAGYSVEADQECHRQQVQAHEVWAQTRSGLAFNPYHRIDADGDVNAELDFPKEMMGYCREELGARCVLENYSLSSPLRDGLYQELYPALLAAGQPLAFQTAAAARIGDWRATLAWAVEVGAASVELNRGYPTYEMDELEVFSQALQDNAGG
jgi:hypothetical protein